MTPEQSRRYGRHLQLEGFGVEAQQRLLDAHACIIGVGGLGAPVALYLAASGVGVITLVDFDVVETSNLQRQIIHTQRDVGKFKVESGAEKLAAINPDIEVRTLARALDADELTALAREVDVFIDCSDNFASRFELNAVCHATQTPLVSGGVIRYEGQVCVFDARDPASPCYQCLYKPVNEGEGETCRQIGVLASAPGIIGSIQASEAIKLLGGLEVRPGRLLLMDIRTMEWRTITLPKDPACPVCGHDRL